MCMTQTVVLSSYVNVNAKKVVFVDKWYAVGKAKIRSCPVRKL